MSAPQNQLSMSKCQIIDVPTSSATRIRNDTNCTTRNNNDETGPTTRRRDAFLFYSDPANMEKSFQQSTTSGAVLTGNQVKRKTRISFEKDPLALMMEDEEFRTEMDLLDGLLGESEILFSELLDELKVGPDELTRIGSVTLPSKPREEDRIQLFARGA